MKSVNPFAKEQTEFYRVCMYKGKKLVVDLQYLQYPSYFWIAKYSYDGVEMGCFWPHGTPDHGELQICAVSAAKRWVDFHLKHDKRKTK